MTDVGLAKQNIHLTRKIIKLAWPTMLEEMMQTAVQYIDIAMVGSLGTVATAAVGSTSTINWLIGSSVYAFAVGLLAYISQALGAGEISKAKKAASQAILLSVITGVIFTIIPLLLANYVPIWMQVDPDAQSIASRYFFIIYIPMLPRCAEMISGTVLKAAGDTKTPLLVGIIMNITNIIMNFFLIFPDRIINVFGLNINIFGADFGVIGAAIASAVSYTLGGIIMVVALLNHKIISPRGYSILPDFTILKSCMKIAIPNMFQRFVTSFGYVLFASMINSCGEISTAAHTVANTVESAFYIPGYGMQMAAATLIGNAIGANDEYERKSTSRVIVFLEIIMMIVSGIVLFVIAPFMVSLFTDDTEVMRLGVIVLRMVSLSEPFYGIAIVVEGMLQGAGQTKIPFIFNVSSMWGIRILGTFICISLCGLGLVSAWACMIGNNILLCIFYILYYRFKFKPKSQI